jgi:hypothetical protein
MGRQDRLNPWIVIGIVLGVLYLVGVIVDISGRSDFALWP